MMPGCDSPQFMVEDYKYKEDVETNNKHEERLTHTSIRNIVACKTCGCVCVASIPSAQLCVLERAKTNPTTKIEIAQALELGGNHECGGTVPVGDIL